MKELQEGGRVQLKDTGEWVEIVFVIDASSVAIVDEDGREDVVSIDLIN